MCDCDKWVYEYVLTLVRGCACVCVRRVNERVWEWERVSEYVYEHVLMSVSECVREVCERVCVWV